MEPQCSVCGSTHFSEHHTGYLVCALCGNQASTQITLMEETPILTPKKHTSRRVMKKTRKQRQPAVTLHTQDYLSLYKEYLDLCVRDLVRECSVPAGAFTVAEEIWKEVARQHTVEDVAVLPKNSEFHIDRRSRHMLPSDIKEELCEVMKEYGKDEKRSIPYRLRDLQKECEARGLSPITEEDLTTRRRQAALLLVGYERRHKEEALEPGALSSEQLLAQFEVLQKKPQRLPLSQMLPILYLTAYHASEDKAILLADVLDWVKELKVRYVTGYRTLTLPRRYISLFRPTTLPAEEWMRREVTALRSRLSLTSQPPLTLMLERLSRELDLPAVLPQLGFKVLECFKEQIKAYRTQRPLELQALAGLFVGFKLLYGLNGIPYSSLCPATRAATQQLAAAQNDKLALLTCSLPPLSQLIPQWKAKFDSQVLFPWTEADLQRLSPAQDTAYLAKLQQSGLLQETQIPEVKSLFLALGPQQDRPTVQPVHSWTVTEYREHWPVNPDLATELDHLQDPQAEIPLPCMDWQTFRKKAGDRAYPSEYVLVMSAFAQLGGRQKLSELHELVDRLEHLIAKAS